MRNNIKHKLHNSHSSNRILHRLKRASSTGSQVLEKHVDRGFVVTLASGTFVRRCQRRGEGWGGGILVTDMSHKHSSKSLKSYKTSKSLPQYCHAI